MQTSLDRQPIHRVETSRRRFESEFGKEVRERRLTKRDIKVGNRRGY